MCLGNRVLQDLEEHREQVSWKNTPPAQASQTRNTEGTEKGGFPATQFWAFADSGPTAKLLRQATT